MTKIENNNRKLNMNHLIQWDRAQYWDKPWNPVVGCNPISPACDNCYAAANCKRFNCSFVPHETSKRNPPRKGVVFCGNMTDLFGDWLEDEERVDFVRRTLGHSDTATYLWLTKRTINMGNALHRGTMVPDDDDCVMSFYDCEFCNQYFGFTAENDNWYYSRIDSFRIYMPHWTNGWLSAEPLLGPINLGLSYIAPKDMPFKWIVVGCESGPKRRPCKIEWVESIVEQAMLRNVPVFVKQLDINGKCVTDISKFPTNLQIRQVPWEV